jgi:dTDP-4-amino-4,6-dideoxygalactose transaminase
MRIKMNKDDFIVFGSPLVEEEEIDEVIDTLRSGWLSTGSKVSRFEEDFAKYKDSKYTVAVNSCTAALHLSLLALGIREGDEVITTPFTFCSTINAIIYTGATPVLVDVNPVTMNISVQDIERYITTKTKVILPVHFAGRPCEMDIICDIASEYNLGIIEDCAHAIEAEYKGRKTGIFGNFGCFSFYATKNLTTGEGGMVLCNNKRDYNKIKILSLHGMDKNAWKRFGSEGYKHYQVTDCGFKYNMSDIHASLGIHQLKHLEKNWLRRKQIWDRYNDEFKNLPITLPPPIISEIKHAYHLYTILVDEDIVGISRDDFLNSMVKNNIGVGVHYMSIPEHPYYQKVFGWESRDYPNAMNIGRRTVSLPLSAKLTDEEVTTIIKTVKRHIVS